MIYDPKLETFIKVADAGSFNKASLQTPISSTALIKQINTLETELDIKLFERSHSGLNLTRAGKSLYKDAKYIIEYSRKALNKAREFTQDDKKTIRIGSSPMTPTSILTDVWPQIRETCPDINIELIPFENTPENASEILRNLGDQIDLVFGIFDETLLELRECSGFEISREPIYCALPIDHPLAQQDLLRMEDLFGQNLMIIRQNWSYHMDRIRDDLNKNFPQINLIDFDFYSLDAFNQCERQNNLMVVIKNWAQVHPMMKILPVEWDYTIPYGILHASNPSETIQDFLNQLRKIISRRSNLQVGTS